MKNFVDSPIIVDAELKSFYKQVYNFLLSSLVLTLSAPKTPFHGDVLLNSPKLSLKFPCKSVGRVLSFTLDKLLCVIIYFILITKRLILSG